MACFARAALRPVGRLWGAAACVWMLALMALSCGPAKRDPNVIEFWTLQLLSLIHI